MNKKYELPLDDVVEVEMSETAEVRGSWCDPSNVVYLITAGERDSGNKVTRKFRTQKYDRETGIGRIPESGEEYIDAFFLQTGEDEYQEYSFFEVKLES